ncbi:MAG TPA: DUF2723 domain-containing protein [Elusimicrobiota bacterium]|nr:DUF2723 domain-containing protein [Elusimicrobiota bacterium]
MIVSLLVFLSVFGVYLSTLYPCIAPEDSGEFITAAWSLGIPHSSGYSVYVLLGKAVSVMVPFGNPAFRVNVLSALAGAGSVLLMAGILMRLLSPKILMRTVSIELETDRWRKTSFWIAALLWALVPMVWYLSLLAEIYMLEIFLGLLAVWGLVRWMETDSYIDRRRFFSGWSLSAFLMGLALSVHHTLVLWMPGLAGLVAARQNPDGFVRSSYFQQKASGHGGFRLKTLLPLSGATFFWLAVGFSVQLFLFFRSSAQPLLDTGDPETWRRFLRVLLRSDYGTFSLARGSDGHWGSGLVPYLFSLGGTFTPVGLVFVGWGLWSLWKKARLLAVSLFLMWFIPGPFFMTFAHPPSTEHYRGIMERFYPLSLVSLAVFLAVGLFEGGRRFRALKWVGALLIPASLFGHLWVSGRANLHARDFGVNLLKSMPAGSVLLDPGDSAAYAVLYQQYVLRNRPDIVSVTYHKTLWGQDQLRRRAPSVFPGDVSGIDPFFLEKLVSRPIQQPVFVEVPKSLPGMNPDDRLPFRTFYPEDSLPSGIAYQFFPSKMCQLADPASQLSMTQAVFWWYRQSRPWRVWEDERDPFTKEIVLRYAEAHTNFGQKLEQYRLRELSRREYYLALTVNPRQMEALNNLGVWYYNEKDGPRARHYFEKAIRLNRTDSSLRNNLGLACRLSGDIDSARRAYDEAIRLDPHAYHPRLNLARICAEEKKDEENVAHLEQLRGWYPSSREVHWDLVQGYLRLKDLKKVKEILRIYETLPLDPWEQERLDSFRRQFLF